MPERPRGASWESFTPYDGVEGHDLASKPGRNRPTGCMQEPPPPPHPTEADCIEQVICIQLRQRLELVVNRGSPSYPGRPLSDPFHTAPPIP
jgi:hypothetical protein